MDYFVFRCDKCGSLVYPLQYPDGSIDFNSPDRKIVFTPRVPDKCWNGHRWVLGIWTQVLKEIDDKSEYSS